MYEPGRAFTYLLLKESVANDVIDVSSFAYNKITLKLKMLTKEDKTLIKMSGNQKKYEVKRLIKEFPNKKWSKRGVEDFQKRLRTTGSIAPGSGRPCSTRTTENVDAVGDLENQPQTRRSTRQISGELGIPQTNNWR